MTAGSGVGRTAVQPALSIEAPGPWRLVWWRFRGHLPAVAALWFLAVVGLLALLGPILTPPLTGAATPHVLPNHPPNLLPFTLTTLMGTDANGDAVASYVLLGARATLQIGLLGALLAAVAGIAIGTSSGYTGGAPDALVMRVVDLFLAVPVLPLLIVLSLYQPQRTIIEVSVMFGLTTWPGVARLARGLVLSLRTREYAEAARALGANMPGILLRHMLPNMLDVLAVSFTLNVATIIVTEATLEFFSVGPDAVTWGRALAYAYYTGAVLQNYWWEFVFPGAALLLTVLAISLAGDGLRDALDVGSRRVTAEPRHRLPRLAAPRPLAVVRQAIVTRPAHLLKAPRAAAASREAAVVPVNSYPRSRIFRLGPLLAAFSMGSGAFLLGHAVWEYAPNFTSPVGLAKMSDDAYAVLPDHRGWNVLFSDGLSHINLRYEDAQGRVLRERTLGTGSVGGVVGMAQGPAGIACVWAAGSGIQIVVLARPVRHVMVALPGVINDLSVVAGKRGTYQIVVDWEPADERPQGLYEITLNQGQAAPPHLLSAGAYDLHALSTSRGMVLLYLQSAGAGRSRVVLNIPGRSERVLGSIKAAEQVGAGAFRPVLAHVEWPLALQDGPHGQIWAAWIEGDVVEALPGYWTSAQPVSAMVAAWDATGHEVLPPFAAEPDFSSFTDGVALAPIRGGGALYEVVPPQVELPGASSGQLIGRGPRVNGANASLVAVLFRPNGSVRGYERVAYDTGGDATAPEAFSGSGGSQVVWAKERLRGAIVETSRYRAAQPPDLVTRFGLNIGNPVVNLILLLTGAVVGAVILTTVNVFLVAPLLAVWAILRRLAPSRIQPLLYTAAIFLYLAYLFTPNVQPDYVLVINGLGQQLSWLAVAGASFVAFWSQRVLLVRQEAAYRAVGTALLALYYIAFMYAVIFIQSEMQHV